MHDRHIHARETLNAARRDFESIGGDDGAARAAADRQSALAEMNDAASQYIRLAVVEEYLEHAAPLPFIADDLFVNYDDGRAAAGLQVLGHLARKTQVLFFTHHQHLIEVARKAVGDSVSTVSLGPRHASGSAAQAA